MDERMGEIMKDDIPASLSYGGFSNPASLTNPTFSRTENVSGAPGSHYVEEEPEETCSSPKKLKSAVLSPDIKSLPCMLEIWD